VQGGGFGIEQAAWARLLTAAEDITRGARFAARRCRGQTRRMSLR